VAGLPQPEVVAGVPAGNGLTPSDVAAAALTLESGEAAGRGTSRIQPAEWRFHPVRSGGRVIAAAGLARDDGAPPFGEEQLPLFNNLLDQLALALERARLEHEARDFAATRERDRLRSALLSSIGQDLKPRLKEIGLAVRELRRSAKDNPQQLSTIASETLKLDRYVDNLAELGPEADHQGIEAGGVSIDLFNRTVAKNHEPIRLTPKEYAVLAELAKHRGRLLTHSYLLRTVWGPAQERQIEYLRVAIRALRQKLEEEPSLPRLIVNEPGVGYRLVAD
jgi:two-component system sensor histidine kinase KdpD